MMQLLLKDDTQVYKQFVENESFKRSVGDLVYAITGLGRPARYMCTGSRTMVERRRGISLSNDLKPSHSGLQKMVVILRQGLGYECGDFVVGETGLPRSLATTAEYYKSAAVMPSKRNGDVGVFWRYGIGPSRQSLRQQA